MEEPFAIGDVEGVLHRPEAGTGDVLVLAHGAGSDCRAPLLVRLSRALESSGFTVLRYNLPYRRARPKGPPFPGGAARDRAGIEQAVAAVRPLASGRLFLGGHSYGGRQSAMLAAARPGIANGLLLLSYPLHPPREPENRRTAFFPELRIPALFVQGTKDPFASIEELREAIALIPARTDLLVVEGAAHDLLRAAGLAVEIAARLAAVCA
ncbi:MAG TPA: alpha/beta fold hydrolase [Bryobacteraceae bacterium]|nr:alpha/beta fold hydrolase [Bryobacteraceae bacterium]